MSLCDSQGSPPALHAGAPKQGLRGGARRARAGLPRRFGSSRDLLRPPQRLAPARTPSQSPHDGSWPENIVAQAGYARPHAPRTLRMDAVEPQAVPLAHAVALVGGRATRAWWGGGACNRDRLGLAGGATVAAIDCAPRVRGEWDGRRAACVDQSDGK